MRKHSLLTVLLSAGFIGGCASVSDSGPKAEARLASTAGNQASGVVSFARVGDKVRVIAEISGLTPGAHGFHVHEKGDCSAPDGTSAGGHFNPGGKGHGHPDQGEHHAGDLPQLIADGNGVARFTAYSAALSIGTGEGNVIGRSVVVHANADDFKSQPAGNSGPRVACGVIAAK